MPIFGAPALPDNVNTTLVEESDTPEQIIAKAVATRPSARQLEAMDDEFIAFACIGPNTFTGREWGTGTEDPAVFDLKTLDTDHGIMSSPFMDGKGDIVRSLSESCARYGIKLGIYLSPADLFQMGGDGFQSIDSRIEAF